MQPKFLKVVFAQFVLLAFGLLNSKLILAESLGPHTHGEAELNLVYDAQTLAIEFSSPAINLLGFEHRPVSPKELAVYDEATRLMKSGGHLFGLEASCQVVESSMELPFDLEHSFSGAEDSAASIDGDHDRLGLHQHNEDEHGNYSVSYLFSCEKLKQIDLELRMLKYFPGIHTLHLQWIAFGQQGAKKLNSESNRVVISP